MTELRFSSQAKKKYDILTGAQRTFIDHGLDHLKIDELGISREMVNEELGMRILFTKKDNLVVVDKIITDAAHDRAAYPEAQQRMMDWNN